ATAARRLWPQTLFGILLAAWFWKTAPGAVWYWAPFIAGLATCIPVAMITAHPGFGRALAAVGICRIPEEAHSEAARLPAESLVHGLFDPCIAPSSAAAE